MNLIDTVIDGTTVELTYSDAPEGIVGDQLLKVRMPVAIEEHHSLGNIRIAALQQAYEFLHKELQRLHNETRR
jgi:hypothetical protein